MPTPSRSGYVAANGVPESMLAPSRFQVGDFGLSATAAFNAVFDDNVEAADSNRESDIFFSVSPSLRAQSLYARHSIGFGAGGTATTAWDNSSGDSFDWQIGADGRLDISRQSKIDAAVGYSQDTLDDEDVDAARGSNLQLHVINSSLGYDYSGERIGFGVGSTLSRLQADDRAFDDRDNTTLGLNAGGRYRWSDRLTFSAGPSYRYSTYDRSVADDGDSRDAHVVSARVGASYQATRTISTSGALGYSFAFFEDPDRKDEDTAIGNVGLTWAPGNGTTLDLRAVRSLGVSIVDNRDARTSTTGIATLSHQLNLGAHSALTSSLSASVSDITDLNRTDRNLTASLGYAYRLAEHAFFTSSYRFSRRDSDDNDADYYRNLISVGVTFSY